MEIGQPPPARVRPGGPAPLLLRTVREHRAELGGISVLTARGAVDTHNAGRFGEALAERLAHSGRTGEHPLPDLTEAFLACADAVRALDGATAALAGSGRVLHVVQPRPHVRETLTAARPAGNPRARHPGGRPARPRDCRAGAGGDRRPR
ncbi:hypothetical protein [Streptomyces sp. NRRL S-31]|uniref:STAS domain-containing protein n=1 Tax=Streptomyces sp. NRRL S-31 TaxID=1463898 RepID=UPI0007C7074C|nr:hypothetical protein [Streptomyces sp. NRRL S-31]